MDRDIILDLAKHYDEKIKKKQTISQRRPISHIDAFYGRGGSSNGLIDQRQSFIDANAGHNQQNSVLNLNSLIQRAQAEQDKSGEADVDYITHRKTKIICSLGSQTNSFPAIIELLKNGMNICRINTGQIQNKEHKILIEMVRKAAKVARKKCGIYIDLQGPRIITGSLKDKAPSVKVKAGQKFLLYCKKKVVGNEKFIGIENSELAKKVKVGDHIICDHGKAFLKVTGFKDEDEFLAEQAERNDHSEKSRIHQVISHRGTLTTIGDNKKTKYEKRQQQLNDLSTKVFLNNDPDMIDDDTGIQNYVRLCHARPVDAQSHQIRDDSAFTHISIDASLFESTRTVGWSEAEEYYQDCDHRLIKQIIAKGRFSNQIAKALHEEKKTEKQYELTTVSTPLQSTAVPKISPSKFGKLGSYNASSDNMIKASLEITPLQTISEETKEEAKQASLTTVNVPAFKPDFKIQPVKTAVTKQQSFATDKASNGDSIGGSFDELKLKSLDSVGVSLTTQPPVLDQSSNGPATPVKPKDEGVSNATLASTPASNPASTPVSTPATTPAASEAMAPTPPAAAKPPAAKPAPAAAGGRRRRVIKKTEVKKKENKVIECTAELDGEIMAGKSIYLPEVDLKEALDLPVVDQQDLILINSLIKLGVDFVSVGGVETKEDLNEVKELLSVKGRHIKLLAKLQSRKALANFEELLEESDGIVIARGQLGLEFQIEDIAFIQQYIIRKCQKVKKPVILSTQIMDSMITRLRPTRSEVADISKAISDGIDCLILTGETSFGPNWKEATEFMAKICYEAEQNQTYEVKYNIKQSILLEKNEEMSIEESMSNNAVSASYMLGAKLIILFSNTGEQAITVAKFSPQCPVLAVLSNESFSKNVLLHSGVFYMTVGSQLGRESLVDTVKKEAMDMKLVRKGDVVIILTGMKEGLTSGNNWIQTDVI